MRDGNDSCRRYWQSDKWAWWVQKRGDAVGVESSISVAQLRITKEEATQGRCKQGWGELKAVRRVRVCCSLFDCVSVEAFAKQTPFFLRDDVTS